jgi:hypothetical protein
MLSLLSIVMPKNAQRNDRLVRRCVFHIVMEKIGLLFSRFVLETCEIKLVTPEEKLAVFVNT